MNIISGQIPLVNLNLFGTAASSTKAFDPAKKPKRWAASPDFDFAAHGIQDFGDFVVFPYAVKFDAAGNPTLAPFVCPKSEVYSLNIPPNTNLAGLGAIQAEYPAPIDPAKWDQQNFYLVNVFGAAYVRDHRADDQQPTQFLVKHARILEALAAKEGV